MEGAEDATVAELDGNLPRVATVMACCRFYRQIPLLQKRVALVVGNSAYQNITQLDNPRNDATLMAETPLGLGFSLIGGRAQLDLDKAALDVDVQNFGRQIQGADVALTDVQFEQADGSTIIVRVDKVGVGVLRITWDNIHANPQAASSRRIVHPQAWPLIGNVSLPIAGKVYGLATLQRQRRHAIHLIAI